MSDPASPDGPARSGDAEDRGPRPDVAGGGEFPDDEPQDCDPSEPGAPASGPRVGRRALLGALGAGVLAAVAGCGTGGDRRAGSRSLVDRTVRVPAGGYETVRFELARDRWVTVDAALSDADGDVRNDGPAVDVVVVSLEAFRRYRAGEGLAFLGRVSMPDLINGRVAGELAAGEYRLLVDNTAVGPADPGESGVTAVLDVEVTAGGPPD